MDISSNAFVHDEIAKTIATLTACAQNSEAVAAVTAVAERCVGALRQGNKILFAGNGGSAADAQHLAAELVGKLAFARPGLAALSLTTDTSILTAIGNDFGYEEVFRRQIEALGKKGDVLVGISTSGRSKNILRAFEAARDRGIIVIGMTGESGGDMSDLCDICLRVPSSETQKIQEGHIVLGHIFCGLVERMMFPRAS